MEYLQWLDIPNEEAEEYIIISITEPTKCAKCHKLIADLKIEYNSKHITYDFDKLKELLSQISCADIDSKTGNITQYEHGQDIIILESEKIVNAKDSKGRNRKELYD